ncbi:hypothetical protein [Methylobacillus flagellatus]|uniref:hypothetical protein n=1 Tax=Methylobacillus flagellatus TaxID=405 RepID=UPI0010F9CB7F|nr:hypothetical protein [Methylobacillus flagellatus]
MHTEDHFLSAQRRWDKSTPGQKIALLREAGWQQGMAHAYRAFIDLPINLKVDLNYTITRQAQAAKAKASQVAA